MKTSQKQRGSKPKITINASNLWLTIKITWTILVVALFLIWLIFTNQNLYPKQPNSFVAKLSNVPFQIMIWPATLVLIFLFFLPIWMTNSYKILMFVFATVFCFILFQYYLLFGLNHDLYWILWLITLITTTIVAILIVVISNWQIINQTRGSRKKQRIRSRN